MLNIKIAAVNFHAVFGDIALNLRMVDAWTARLTADGVNAICFPEMALCGYDRTEAILPYCQPIPGPAAKQLAAIAARYEVTLLIGLAEAGTDGRCYISQLVVSPVGIVGIYRKTHLSPLERTVFTPGAAIGVFDSAWGRFGLQLCYDSHFPELSTAQALAGAEVLFVGFATSRDTPRTLRDRLLRYLPARAYDNTCYVVACNLVGQDHRKKDYPGVALVINPKGEVITECVGWDESAAIAVLDNGEIARIRATKMGHFLSHRRPELYK